MAQYKNLLTGGIITSRRDFGKGLAAILAAGSAPAICKAALLGARGSIFANAVEDEGPKTWLMSDGTAGIIEDIEVNVLDKFETKQAIIKDGVTWSNDPTMGWYAWSQGSFVFNFFYGNSGKTATYSVRVNAGWASVKELGTLSIYTSVFVLDPSTGVFCDGEQVGSSYTPVKRTNTSFGFFGQGGENSRWMNRICHGNTHKIYYVKHWRDGVLIRHWVPYLDGTDACFLDKITGVKIYGVSTTGVNRDGIKYGTDMA